MRYLGLPLVLLALCASVPRTNALDSFTTVTGVARGSVPADSSQVEVAIAGKPIAGYCHAIPAEGLLSVARSDVNPSDTSLALAELASKGISASRIELRSVLERQKVNRLADVVTCPNDRVASKPRAAMITQIFVAVPQADATAYKTVLDAVSSIRRKLPDATLAALVLRSDRCTSPELLDRSDGIARRTASMLAVGLAIRLGALLEQHTTAVANPEQGFQALCGSQLASLPTVQEDAALELTELYPATMRVTVRSSLTFQTIGRPHFATNVSDASRLRTEPTANIQIDALLRRLTLPYVVTRGQVFESLRPDYFIVWLGRQSTLTKARNVVRAAGVAKADEVETQSGVFLRLNDWKSVQVLLRAESMEKQQEYGDQLFLPAVSDCASMESAIIRETVYQAYLRAQIIATALHRKLGPLSGISAVDAPDTRFMLCGLSRSVSMASVPTATLPMFEDIAPPLARAVPNATVTYGVAAAWAFPMSERVATASRGRATSERIVSRGTYLRPGLAIVSVPDGASTNVVGLKDVWLQQPSERVGLVAGTSNADLAATMLNLSRIWRGSLIAASFGTGCLEAQLDLLRATARQLEGQRRSVAAVIDEGYSYSEPSFCGPPRGFLYANWDADYKVRVTQTLRILSQ